MVRVASAMVRGRVLSTTTTTTAVVSHLVPRSSLSKQAKVFSLSIDSCHNKVSADQYHMTVSRA